MVGPLHAIKKPLAQNMHYFPRAVLFRLNSIKTHLGDYKLI